MKTKKKFRRTGYLLVLLSCILLSFVILSNYVRGNNRELLREECAILKEWIQETSVDELGAKENTAELFSSQIDESYIEYYRVEISAKLSKSKRSSFKSALSTKFEEVKSSRHGESLTYEISIEEAILTVEFRFEGW